MKKRTISKLKSIFGSKKGKRQHQSLKSSRTPSPEPEVATPPCNGESFRPLPRTPPPTRVCPPPSPPVPTHPIAPVAPEPSGPLPLLPCAVCGRTFVPESLAKHVKICEKMTVKKRKTFDSSRQRREGLTPANGANSGTDLEQYLPKNFGLPENSPFLEKSPPNTAKVALKPKPVSVRATITKPMAELQKCPHCGRAFGVRAFERHVEWCGDKAKILPAAPAQPPHVADAKQRLNARTQYKAPPVRGRRSSQTRDKSSNSRSASVESSRGVSPPPPPRECGDYKPGRTRASESLSSNDHEDSPHIPVIRNSRNSLNNTSGDANVRARQARLARDLSSSRKPQESHPPSAQQSKTDPNIQKNAQQNRNKLKNNLNVKKQQQLKKLEEIANKYKEKMAIKEETNTGGQKNHDKSQIPITKKATTLLDKNKKCLNEIEYSCTNNEFLLPKHNKNKPLKISDSTVHKNKIQSASKELIKNKTTKHPIKLAKETSMSLDSLEDGPVVNSGKTCQSIGINTELLCPCVPCIIYEATEQKQPNKICKANRVAKSNVSNFNNDKTEPKIELLYKNLTMVSSCDIQSKIDSEKDESMTDLKQLPTLSSLEKFRGGTEYNDNINLEMVNLPHKESIKKSNNCSSNINDQCCEDNHDLSAEHLEENFEPDLSGDNLNDSLENFCYDDNYNEESGVSRHGSGETYTKFTDNAQDLEEFINLTDKMMDNETVEQSLDMDKLIENVCTPNTNSLEAINSLDNVTIESDLHKRTYSDTFEELKNNLQELLASADKDTVEICKDTDEDNRKVLDMEHITVYGLKFYEKKAVDQDNVLENVTPVFKLPSISENNKPERKVACNKKRIQEIYKTNGKYKRLSEQKRANTFILKNEEENSDNVSITSEAPPLKLPRIEIKRIDDNYDPFVSAARQMKELMSSDTNIPKKIQNASKDPNRTLPILRPAKEKSSSSYLRSDNTKMMKDTLNKTYQKTPTLQRMKSFGNTCNENTTNTIGSRCSSFRINRNDKKSSPKLNTTFTKSSKENVSTIEKTYFTRNSALNRSFSSYTGSNYSTPKPKDKIPKIATSMYHGFQRTTIKQPVKLDKIKRDDEKKDFVNLDVILVDDNSSMTDSNYIDPRLINENDNLPINVNTILNNPDIISSMESLQTTENLPAKFESFNLKNQNNNDSIDVIEPKLKAKKIENNNKININTTAPIIDDLSAQYDKIMSSLEQSIASKVSIRDDDSLCEDFDLEEFMTSFDEEINKQKIEKRTCSSTTRVVKQSELADSNRVSEMNSISSSPKVVKSCSNGNIPVNKSMSLHFSSNNLGSESLFPSSVKRSTSLLDSIQKKKTYKMDSSKSRSKADQLEQDIMQSLKDFDKFYEPERNDNQSNREIINYNTTVQNGTARRDSRLKSERKNKKTENISNGNYTPNGKACTDSAYSSLNRISPSKLSLCNSKDQNGLTSLEQIPAGSDSSGSHKEDIRSVSSEEFLAMERSAELDGPLPQIDMHTPYKALENHPVNEKRANSRASSRQSPTWKRAAGGGQLSSSGSEASLHAPRRDSAPRLSRFCHECGSKFPVETAKFCIECGVKRLFV